MFIVYDLQHLTHGYELLYLSLSSEWRWNEKHSQEVS